MIDAAIYNAAVVSLLKEASSRALFRSIQYSCNKSNRIVNAVQDLVFVVRLRIYSYLYCTLSIIYINLPR